MTSLTENRLTVTTAVAVPCAAAAWWLFLTASPAVASTSVFVALMVVAVAFVGLNTWYNGQATGSLAQVIHEADTSRGYNPDDRSSSG